VLNIFVTGIISGYEPSGDVKVVRDLITLNIMVLITAFMVDRKHTIMLTVFLIASYFVMAFVFNIDLYADFLIFMSLFTLAALFIYSMLANLIEKTVKASMDAKEEVETLGRFRHNIIRLIFHDIKVPVGSIIELNRDLNTSGAQKTVFYARSIIKHLENVLDVEKLEEAELKPEYSTVNIAELIQSSIFMVETIADQKELKIICKNCVDGTIKCDRNLTVRVLTNLLSNAIKYSDKGKSIFIDTLVVDDKIKITVIDEGIGIDEQHLQKIFSKYYMVNPNSSNELRSSGLGLTFCKLAIEAQNGEIEVYSRLGEGSKFGFTLPGYSNGDLAISINFSEKNNFSLTSSEKMFLLPLCQQIQAIPVYKLSEIIVKLKEIEIPEKGNISTWNERITAAVYAGNQYKYNALIEKVISQNDAN
jgi:signal transduction histidine kinase